ncbi:MAG: aldehyde dehydrogenase [Deltaproteobacteria bacterium]|jgi:acyl-CoA reductase-like NAD-dependent aldehyde dehydrogenase|nr:Succinate-semialdehyde dehydrogenase [NADP(+)] GabD [bacterium HR37]GIW46315.1 MAG: aldehyde dehydrogenase [Deltaproteobacteria bacterium]
MVKEYGFLADGKWLQGERKREIKSPYNDEVVGVINIPSLEQAREAINAAERAFEKFKNAPSYERSRILRNIVDGIEKRKEEFARILVNEGGKPIKTARLEVNRAMVTFSVAAEEANRFSGGEVIPIDIVPGNEERFGIVKRFPLGIVMGISPFNFPLNLVAHKVAPAIASGNVMILKPASQTPLSALALGEVVMEAGLLPGGLNILPLPGSKIEPVIEDERIKKVSFTGSDEIGWDLMKKFPKKKVTLELGGNAATIIDEDPPDLEYAVSRSSWGAFYQAGQSCISVQRMYVHEKIFDKFLDKFISATKALKVGDPRLEDTDVGPVIDDDSADRIMKWIEEAINSGAKLLTGGQRDGRLIQPTVLTNVPPTCKVSCDEVFGPVVHVERYKDFDEVLRWVNDSRFGLQAGIFTKDMKKAFKAYSALEVGGVIVNDVPSFRVENMPYGGVKDSGVGREGIRYAIEEMTELKLMVVNLKNYL